MALGKKDQSEAERKTSEVLRLAGLRKNATRPVSCRLSVSEYDQLRDFATREGFTIAALVKSWILQRLREQR